MKKTITHPTFGEITYEESLWTGKKTIAIGGTVLPKESKNRYLMGYGENAIPVAVQGSVLTGVSINIQGQWIEIFSKPAWYDWALSILPFVLILVWGNSVQLCSIIPVIGGAIGGALGGGAMVLTMLHIREKGMGRKLLIALLTTLVTFVIGAVLGYVFLVALLAGTM